MTTTSTLAPITMVNGFACRTCTDVDYAKKHIDPAHPKDGPYGINAHPAPDGTAPGRTGAGGDPGSSRGRFLDLAA